MHVTYVHVKEMNSKQIIIKLAITLLLELDRRITLTDIPMQRFPTIS